MPTLSGFQGGSLVPDLQRALQPTFQQAGAEKREAEDIQLLRQAQGLAPVPQANAGGFLSKVAPGLASKIQQLNTDRTPDLIDQARGEAETGIETSRRILAAKTPAEKQKIILARAEEVQRQGGDARELLRMSNMSAAEIDLQAQKTAMTGDAALKALPAPTEQERLAARAALAVRSPNALRLVLHDEQIAREEQRRREALAAANARAGRAKAAEAAHNEAFNQIIDAVGGTPEQAATEQTGVTQTGAVDAEGVPIVSAASPEPVSDAQALAAGAQAAPGATREEQIALGREGIAQEDAQINAAAAAITGQGAPEPSATERFANEVRVANENANKAREFLRDPNPAVRAAAKDVVKYYEDQAKDAIDSFNFEVTAAEAAEVEETEADEEIRLLQETGLTREEAILRALDQEEEEFKYDIREIDGVTYYVDPTGERPAVPVVPREEQPEPVDFETEAKLRKEFGGISTVKDFYAVNDSYRRIQASAEEPSAAGDLALIFNYMKMLDPGSVVRESEFATAQNSAGVPERIRAQYNNVLQGQRLTDVTRADFVGRAARLYEAQAEGFNQVVTRYQDLANQYGLDPNRIAQKAEAEGIPPEQAAVELRGDPAQAGAQVSITSQAEYDALPSGTVFTAPDGTTRRKP